MNKTPLLPFVASPCTQALAVRIYAQVRARDPARMYVRRRIFCPVAVRRCTRFRRDSLNCYVGGGVYYDMCRYLLGHSSSLQSDRSTSMYIHVRDKTDNGTYASSCQGG